MNVGWTPDARGWRPHTSTSGSAARYLAYTPEEESVRAELRAYFETIMTPEVETRSRTATPAGRSASKTPRRWAAPAGSVSLRVAGRLAGPSGYRFDEAREWHAEAEYRCKPVGDTS
jgi:hypothetical protein